VELHKGAWRVHGILSVSRSIGDAHLKDWVIAEPDTKILHLSPDMDFLVLASDGLWEQVTLTSHYFSIIYLLILCFFFSLFIPRCHARNISLQK